MHVIVWVYDTIWLFPFLHKPTDWEAADASLECDRSVGEVDWAVPGTVAGLKMLESFIKGRLKYFGGSRNDPTKPVLSNMSPWYHFGEHFFYSCFTGFLTHSLLDIA